ncbi:MAG TPA: hypothetical protein VGP26_25415 [Actinophytocola sp.]|jgi:hypothetical protein|nr:hypothetical protein [Actinophytocola sp.]
MTLELSRVSSVVVFGSDWIAAAHWWSRMCDTPVIRLPRSASVMVGTAELVFAPPDERNDPGGSPVPYWHAEDFNDTRAELSGWGCVELHRPVATPARNQITQFKDPFGMIFGIEGPLIVESPLWPEVEAEIAGLRAAYGVA